MTSDKTITPSADGNASPLWARSPTVGNNGVAVAPRAVTQSGGYRSYEVHQRQRVRESTEKIKPSDLTSPTYQADPYPILDVVREHYPCYRDWVGNAYWVTRYDDVTSIFTDDANFETRSKLWRYGLEGWGQDLRDALPVLTAQAQRMDSGAETIARSIVSRFANEGRADLAIDFAAQFAMEMLAHTFDIPAGDLGPFTKDYWLMQRGVSWDTKAQAEGAQALHRLKDYVTPLFEARRRDPGDDMISAIASLDLASGATTPADVVTTLLEADHETLQGSLANMWLQLLTHPDQLAWVKEDPLMLKFAYFETLRHSAPVLSAQRFARHEVERFGQLLPEGALVMCSAAAANRDPRIFDNPDVFDIARKDLCQREARGQYRADGLAAGIAFGLGKPSKHPAVPEDRPRSLYALTRDIALTASRLLLEACPDGRLENGATPTLRSLRVGDMHTCWHLPVQFSAP